MQPIQTLRLGLFALLLSGSHLVNAAPSLPQPPPDLPKPCDILANLLCDGLPG